MPYIYAFSGIVWWNEVSNTRAIGVLGITSMHAFKPVAAAGLCRGASSKVFSSKVFNTSEVTSVVFLKYSPLATILCPTASISSIDFITPISPSCKALSTSSIAILWLGIS